MDNSTVTINKYGEEAKVGILSLNRPEKLNALNETLIHEILYHMEHISKQEDIKALIIDSKLEKSFCTGIDIDFVKNISNEKAEFFFSSLNYLLEKLANFPLPTLAITNGYTFGAGADLVLACDLRLGSSTSQFRFPGPQFGVILGTHRLVNEVGPSVARKLLFSNQIIQANQALKYGLIQEVVEEEYIEEVALEWSTKLMNLSHYTINNIRDICTPYLNTKDKTRTPREIVKNSIMSGDFNERLINYIERIKSK